MSESLISDDIAFGFSSSSVSQTTISVAVLRRPGCARPVPARGRNDALRDGVVERMCVQVGTKVDNKTLLAQIKEVREAC